MTFRPEPQIGLGVTFSVATRVRKGPGVGCLPRVRICRSMSIIIRAMRLVCLDNHGLDFAPGERVMVERVMDDDISAVSPVNRSYVDRRPNGGIGADQPLSIGMFARRSFLSMKALRLYDRLGLLTPDHVDPATGYRRYHESQLKVARLVAMLRRLDMPLAQVAQVLSAPQAARAKVLEDYWDSVERRVASQRELVAHLVIRLSGDERNLEMFEVKQREIPEQLVLTEQRHLHVGELPDWLGATMPRQWKQATELGGMVAPQFVIFHGEVNQDSDGPVEVCTPIESDNANVDVPTRIEPAHKEAYVRLRKAQVAYPQILSAYDAVAQWLATQNLTMSAAPREVYFTDFMAAGPDDEVCDVAYPI
jgi:DNA-binding transcriptional MerR regulator